MHDFDWIDNELVRSSALQATSAPARWLGRLGVAVIEAERLMRRGAEINLFRYAPWLAATDPLAALGRVIDAPANPAPSGESVSGAPAHWPDGAARRWPTDHSPFAAGAPSERRPFLATSTQESGAHRSPTLPSRPIRDDLFAAGIIPPQARPPLSERTGAQLSTPLPEITGTPLSTQQLARLANGQQITSAGTRQPAAPGAERTGATVGTRGAPPARGHQSHTVAGANSPAGAQSRSIVQPERPPIDPAAIAHTAATAGRLGIESTPAGMAYAPPPTVELPPAGAALLARLTEPLSASGDGETTADFPNLARRAIAQAFRTIVQPSMLPASRLSALAGLDSRLWSGADRQHTDRGPDRSNRPPAPPVPSSAGRSTNAPGAQAELPPGGLGGLALLRESVAAFANAAPSEAPQPQNAARMPQPASAGSFESVLEHPHPPDLLAPLGSSGEAIGLPAVQNTFNITLHMAGGLENGEEELAERLTRILMDQARRYGIDI